MQCSMPDWKQKLSSIAVAAVAAPLSAWSSLQDKPLAEPMVRQEQQRNQSQIRLFHTFRGWVLRQTIMHEDEDRVAGYTVDISPYFTTQAEADGWLSQNKPNVDKRDMEKWDSFYTSRKHRQL